HLHRHDGGRRALRIPLRPLRRVDPSAGRERGDHVQPLRVELSEPAARDRRRRVDHHDDRRCRHDGAGCRDHDHRCDLHARRHRRRDELDAHRRRRRRAGGGSRGPEETRHARRRTGIGLARTTSEDRGRRRRLVLRKLVGSALTLVFVVCFNFFLFRVVPTDPLAHMFRGRSISREAQDALRVAFGLDQPIGTQFLYYLRETFTGNLGISYHSRQPVWDEIVERMPATLALLGLSWLLAALIGTLGGIIAGWRRNTWKDRTITSTTMLFYSVPDFWLGILLLVGFSVILGWFPIGGMHTVGTSYTGFAAVADYLRHLFLPAL